MTRDRRPRPPVRAPRPGFRLRVALAILGLIATAGAAPSPVKPALRVRGRHFVDPSGRVVVLRGVNLAGNSKVPPFRPVRDVGDLDPLAAQGFNLIRLVVTWEALEPRPGQYDPRYLADLRAVTRGAAERGLLVILDIHQDGFSRHLSHGRGDGFPAWAASPQARLHEPKNDRSSPLWPLLVAADPGMHRSFRDFYADTHGVRTRYLAMLGTLARAFADDPAVIGYDLLNEPWGAERTELGPLYRDAARAVRAEDPTAILFLEGHVTTNMGLQTRLPRPEFDNVAYSPHYYKPTAILLNAWLGETLAIDGAFAAMGRKAADWDAPLLLSEFGAPADAFHAGDYVAYLYRKLDDGLASGAQWNVTPGWDERGKDGWNGEDFNLLDPATGRPRANFRPRPFPHAVAGTPLGFRYEESPGPLGGAWVDFLWDADPARGETEVFLPAEVFPEASAVRIEPADAAWRLDPSSRLLHVRAARAGIVRLRVTAP